MARQCVIAAALLSLACSSSRPASAGDHPAASSGAIADALAFDRLNNYNCGKPNDSTCVGPSRFLADTIERLASSSHTRLRDRDASFIAATGSKELAAAIADHYSKPADVPKSRRRSTHLLLSARLGEARACSLLAQDIAAEKNASSRVWGIRRARVLCPREVGALIPDTLGRAFEEAQKDHRRWSRPWRERGEPGAYSRGKLAEFATIAADLGARAALPILVEIDERGLGIDWSSPPIDGQFPPGEPAIDVARLQLGDRGQAALVRRWLATHHLQLADVEPVTDGLGFQPEDAPILLELANRFPSPGPARALDRYVRNAQRVKSPTGRWHVDAIAEQIDRFASRRDSDRLRSTWLESARLALGREGAATRLLAIAAGESNRKSTWRSLAILLDPRARVEPSARGKAYERAIELFEGGVQASNEHVDQERSGVLTLAAATGRRADGRWAIALFDHSWAMREHALREFGRYRPAACDVLERGAHLLDLVWTPRPQDERGLSRTGVHRLLDAPAFAFAVLPTSSCSAEANAVGRDTRLAAGIRMLGPYVLALRGESFDRLFVDLFTNHPHPKNRAARQLINIAEHSGANLRWN